MLGSIGTKLALKKLGLPKDPFDFSGFSSTDPNPDGREPNKLRKQRPDGATAPSRDDDDEGGSGAWTSWMSLKSLPLTVHPWLSPPPPPVDVARVPRIGDPAPRDAEGRLVFVRGRRTLVVFLRCVGCAFAQKTFLNLRTLSNKYNGALDCVAVSHSSAQATRRWIDMLGGAWDVRVIIDERRALYAAYGLGLGSVWYVLNPATQVQGWREKGWLGDKVAGAMARGGGGGGGGDRGYRARQQQQQQSSSVRDVQQQQQGDEDEDAVNTTLGNKWQEAGSFAVDGRGTVIWGGKALKADDVMDLDEGAKLLMM
ncbi:hypothetical protein NLU13_2388 [Sarocladium strictum]|uniref:Uncharacterized protein n=1 Tax=Sarocladium strictum TaxID=5046 RepID=A0AA39GTH7_SARSR|nr:hypothetical protein NLU13_2388 [Sarocladium strictum]